MEAGCAGMIEPRWYQQESVDFYFECPDRGRTPIQCAPTGSGKTIIQALIAHKETQRGRRGAILTPRFEIFEQTQKVLELPELIGPGNVGLLRAGEQWHRHKPVHVISWPTLTRRMARSTAWMPDVDYVLVDEAHLSVAPKILEALYYFLPRAKIHAFTATPARASGKGLGAFYSDIRHVVSVRQLVKEGYLCPMEYWGGSYADVTGLKKNHTTGDWEVKKLSERSVELVGDVIDNWIRLARDRHTLVFAVDIPHAEALCDRFLKLGVSAGVVHNKMTPAKRNEEIEKFRERRYQVLCNVMIASYGFDVPSIDCVVNARRTRSIVLWLQMLGRGMRPMDGKSECLVLDHGNCTRELGQATDLFRWRLTGGKATANWSRDKQSGEKKESHTYECEKCSYLFSGARVCPECGWEVPVRKADVSTKDADLVRISGKIAKELPDGWPDHETVWRMLLGHAKAKGYAVPGWAIVKFKKLTDVVAPTTWNNLAALTPNERVQNWINKEARAYAIRRSYGSRKNKKRSAANATR